MQVVSLLSLLHKRRRRRRHLATDVEDVTVRIVPDGNLSAARTRAAHAGTQLKLRRWFLSLEIQRASVVQACNCQGS